jgi:hypothetical protein
MNTIEMIDPSVCNKGTEITLVGLPEVPPSLGDGYHIVALLSGSGHPTAELVSEPAAYAEMYAKATAPGCNYNVRLFSVHSSMFF